MPLSVMAPAFKERGASLLAVAFAPGARWLATGDSRGDLIIWDLAGRDLPAVLPASCRKPWLLAFSPDGRVLAGVSEDGGLVVWDMRAGETWAAADLGMNGARAAAVRGSLLAAALPNGAMVRDLRARRTQAVIAAPADDLLSLAFGPTGDVLAGGGRRGVVQFWDPASGHCHGGAQACRGAVSLLAFTPDGSLLAVSGENQAVVLLDVVTRRARGSLRGYDESIESMAFTPDGGTLVTAGYDGVVRLWEVATCRERARLAPEHGPIGSVASLLDCLCPLALRTSHPSGVWTEATRAVWRAINEEV